MSFLRPAGAWKKAKEMRLGWVTCYLQQALQKVTMAEPWNSSCDKRLLSDQSSFYPFCAHRFIHAWYLAQMHLGRGESNVALWLASLILEPIVTGLSLARASDWKTFPAHPAYWAPVLSMKERSSLLFKKKQLYKVVMFKRNNCSRQKSNSFPFRFIS